MTPDLFVRCSSCSADPDARKICPACVGEGYTPADVRLDQVRELVELAAAYRRWRVRCYGPGVPLLGCRPTVKGGAA